MAFGTGKPAWKKKSVEDDPLNRPSVMQEHE